MSDISIPGVNSKYNTSKMVDDLVKVEKTKLEIKKNEEKDLEDQKKIWLNFSRLMTGFRTLARSMYSFDTPFAERSASSSDTAVSARASREASEGSTRIEVLRLSQADRFSSGPIPKDMKIPEGTYTFEVGEKRVSYRFHGGTIKDFIAGLNNRGEGNLKASIIQNKPDSNILIIESLKTGSKWPMSLKDDALALGLKIGLVGENRDATYKASMATDSIKGISSGLAENKTHVLEGGTLTVKPGTQLRINLPGLPALTQGMVLTFDVRVRSTDPSQVKPEAPPGPRIPVAPGATVKDLTLPNFPSTAPLPDWKAPEPPPVKIDDNLISLGGNGPELVLPPIQDSQDFRTLTVPVGKDFPGLSSIFVHNNNTYRSLEIKNISIQDPLARGQYKPLNPISNAQDALIKVEGIEIERESNTITDAIPGVTLTLNDTSKEKILIKVEPDRKLVKEKLIELVAQYNGIIREVNILTARKGTSEVVDEVDFFTDKEKEEALKKLGQYQGDSTLGFVKNKLQVIMASPYKPGNTDDLVLLNNAGISTNASGGGGTVQTSKLRGYLEIDEKKLDKVLADNFLGLKALFGFDSNGDLIADQGAGVELDKYIQPYVQIGGIIAGKTAYFDARIKDKNEEIKKFQDYLVTYEDDLRKKYGRMEGALNQIQNSAKELNNLNNNNNGN